MQSSTSHAPPSGDNNEESPQITDYDKQMNDASSLLDLAKSSMPATVSNIVVNNSSNNNNITFADTTTVGSNNIASSSTNAKAKASRQKNDKPVEVCHGLDKKVIARFKTQTECACYLRATPEAVSYHCSRGGGVCNGLFVRPVVVAVASTTTSSSSATVGEGSAAAGENNMYFGLFDGSSTHRPPARPQISTEVVSILKAWLLSPGHIDNPYPTGLEFDALMETTKLDKMQLKHWFNNARKRIWKPLVKSEGRLMPKFGKIGKRSRSAVSGEDTNNIDGVPDAAPASSSHAASTDITKRGGRKRTSTSNKRRKTNDSTTMMAEGGGGGGASSNVANNMCHSIGGQDYFHRSDDSRVSTGSSNSNNNNLNMLMMDRYSRLLGNMGMFSQGNNGGGGPPPMMGGHSMMNSSSAAAAAAATTSMNRSMMMMDPSAGATTFHHNSGLNSNKSYFGMSASSNTNNSGGGGGSFMSRDGGGLLSSSFQGCMEVNDGGSSNYHGGMRNETGQELPYNATSTSTTGNTMNYCQPLIQPNNITTSSSQGQGFPIKKKKNSVHSASLIESVRSNAVFKQQVASMAMNEASTSFKEMEDAFARSKDIAARVRDENNNIPEADDVRVMEANAHAKACQNTAMFKLKVSQRASEEAASAYDCYLRLVEDNDSLV